MPKKAPVPWKIAPLQRIVAEPVTDPAEIAAMEELRKREKQKQRERKKAARKQARAASKSPPKKKR
jgi:hypothetical protein